VKTYWRVEEQLHTFLNSAVLSTTPWRSRGSGGIAPRTLNFGNIFCLIKHYAVKTYWGNGGIASRILNLGSIYCLIKHYAVTTYWGSGGMASRILNLRSIFCLIKHYAVKTYWGAEV